MGIEEKAKAYEMALEAARKELGVDRKEWEVVQRVLHNIFSELRESEDERIMKELIDMIKECTNWPHKKEYLKYLEKQKENPKSADSILPNCTSDAKNEDRWHKVTDSLPDNGREVLAKDKLGNTLLARYDGDGWDVSVYDDEDYRCHNGISKWCEIPSEKQKDHFRDDTKMIELQDYYGLNDLERAIHRGFLAAGVENVPVAIIKETANECKRTQTIANENANAEWSEDDEQYLLVCNNALAKYCASEYWSYPIISKWLVERLKFPSPQSKEELAKMLQEEYNKGREEGERIGYTKGYNKGYKDAEEEYNKAVSYHQ